jgi:hypothetical protein
MKSFIISIALLLSVHVSVVWAHVPYFEKQDYSEENPHMIKDSIEKSKAIYAYLETGSDVDIYTFKVTKPVRVYTKALVPVCAGNEKFLPWLAVVGPGLPPPDSALHLEIPEGYGAILVKNLAPDKNRPTFYEPFGAKHYYDAPAFDRMISSPGTWYIYYWDPYDMGGDYVAVFGYKERFSLTDMVRALIKTPQIWFDRELHHDCP